LDMGSVQTFSYSSVRLRVTFLTFMCRYDWDVGGIELDKKNVNLPALQPDPT
jgi:hypothetical protein